MNLQDLKNNWVDEPNYHKMINETFIENVNECKWLREHRDFVEQNAFGFGERSFHYMWSLLINEMPNEFSFMEIGVFRFQIVSLVKLLALHQDKIVHRYCITPLDSTDGHWESDYAKDGETIHDEFDLPKDYILYKGLSTNLSIVKKVKDTEPYDIVYIDGGHAYEVIKCDLDNFPSMVKVNGYLVIDDACTDMNMPWGFFQGISSVTNAVLEWENDNFEFQFNVVHLRVYKRIS